MGKAMSWLDVVTAYLGAVASGNVKAVKQLVSKDVKYKDGIMELNGIDELLTVVSQSRSIFRIIICIVPIGILYKD